MRKEEEEIKPQLRVKSVDNDFTIKWVGKITDAKPQIRNGKPIFAVAGGGGRIELNTTDMTRVQRAARMCTQPKGRGAFASDYARIYVIQEDDSEKLLGVVTHYRTKTFYPVTIKEI